MKPILAAGLVAVVMLPVACKPAAKARSSTLASVAGCYRINLGRWSWRFPSGLTTEHIPPEHFELDTALLGPPDDAWHQRRVMPQMLVVAPRHVWPAGWRFNGADSIEVTWSTGFAGVRLRLRSYGDTLRGRAQSFYDVVGPLEPTASVIAIKTASYERCDIAADQVHEAGGAAPSR
jgi:hypothetical protein